MKASCDRAKGAGRQQTQLEQTGLEQCPNNDGCANDDAKNKEHGSLEQLEVQVPNVGLGLSAFGLLSPGFLALTEESDLPLSPQPLARIALM